VRGIDTPALCHAFIVSPEQSNPVGPLPPQMYGLPSCALAKATACLAAEVGVDEDDDAWCDDGALEVELDLEVEVDPGLCIGAQRCVYLAPDIFEMGEDGFATVKPLSGAELDEKIIQVARQCPNYAILVRRDGEVIVGEDVV